jgi:hypothetical protein
MASQPWFRVNDQEVDVEEVMDEIRRRVALQQAGEQVGAGEDPEQLARQLYREMISDRDSVGRLTYQDCDVLPQDYTIDWHIPILGPLHGIVRRIINAEIRRYLEAGLTRQARFNRQVLLELQQLRQQNQALREQIKALEGEDQRI